MPFDVLAKEMQLCFLKKIPILAAAAELITDTSETTDSVCSVWCALGVTGTRAMGHAGGLCRAADISSVFGPM